MTRRLRQELLRTLPRVRRFAASLSGDRDDADDLLQSTVARVLERGVPDGADLQKWMFKVCKNLWIDEIRSRKVRREAAARPELKNSRAVCGETAAVDGLTVREVEEAMQSLPETQRALLSLVAAEGLTYREAAEVLEIPIGTVMSRLARARTTLAARFAGRGGRRGDDD